MPLIVHEIIHFTLSLLVAVCIFLLYKDMSLIILIAIALAGGFFIDTDHLLDYFIGYRWDFKLGRFLKGSQFGKIQRLFVLFHGYEYIALLIFIGYFIVNKTLQGYIFALAFSSLFHLITDVLVNNVYVQTYSITYRILHDFKLHEITPYKHKKGRLS